MSSVPAMPAKLWRRPGHPCGCPGPCSELSGLELGPGAPPCTFRRTPKRNGADCPAGGSSLIVTGVRSGWNAMRICSGSGARNSPGTVLKATASAHSIQIGYRRADSLARWTETGRTQRSAPFILPLSAVQSVAIKAQARVVQTDCLTGTRAEGRVVELLEVRHGIHRRLGLFGRLYLDVAVTRKTGTRRDELSEDNVLLQAQQGVGLGVDRRVRQHPGGLLEGRR